MERKKRVYRKLKPLDEARQIVIEAFKDIRVGTEQVPVRESLGRILAEPVVARESVPAYHAAAMDGIAVKASETFGALPEKPIILPKGGHTVMIDTGDPMPEGLDAVVMIEKVEETEEGWKIREAVYPWRNVRKAGEDMVKGEIILPARHRIRAFDQAAMLAAGIYTVKVMRKPSVLIIPTGSEIVVPEEAPESLPKGAILEVDGQMLASMSEECGASVRIHEPVKDIESELKKALKEALAKQYDLIMLIAGSSAGTEDFTPPLLEKMGRLLVHGVTVMPGKPTLIAEVEGRPVVGIPGYPVSAAVAFREFVRPLLYMLQGIEAPKPEKVTVAVGRKIPSKLGLEEHVRVIIGNVGGRLVAIPLAGGAGVISSIVRADGIIRIPQEVGGLSEGEETEAELLSLPESISGRLVAIGSHDLTIDLIGSMLKERTGGRVQISSSNVGSLGGLIALRKQTAHFAGSHLLDEETGGYNESFIKRYLPSTPVKLVTLVHRWQGFMVAAGNPKSIQNIQDLKRSDIVFVNRQAGSGTRILFDYELRKAGIPADTIAGYYNEEYTHMNVAMAVASGAADVGLGILAAAKALSLDFIPIAKERYDLVIPSEYLEDEKIQLMLQVIRSDEFKQRVLAMGGYEVDETGKFVN
ncbi:MAG: molybdopterin biosynthesis protein [Firmicutes bacterium]|nr:molybdopterin biosynthesis protein [Bacillota bacterium]